jgi:hypothetical protein
LNIEQAIVSPESFKRFDSFPIGKVMDVDAISVVSIVGEDPIG